MLYLGSSSISVPVRYMLKLFINDIQYLGTVQKPTKQNTLLSQTDGPLGKYYVSKFCYLKSMNLGCRVIIFEMIGKKEK